ncbi:methyltransferase domain-containing protein [Lysinibacillus odysseyi]|uniref:methyltransferase domain-containing protein n=1 Tax=Lysinibacillus odysseyi TaxID=202611 RepID=UPI000AF4FEC9|nr:methyltransferase domain-containing protein [Lysinibacillus odysseyi]
MLSKQGFNLWANDYDKSVKVSEESGQYPFAGYKAILGSIFNEVMQGGKKNVLDIGIGTGVLAVQLAAHGHHITGLDFSKAMLETAKQKLPQAALYEWDLQDGLPPEIEQQRFDTIISTYTLHHFRDGEKVLLIQKLLNLLTPGGKLYIGDVAFSTAAELEGCREESIRYWDDDEYYFVHDELKPLVEEFCYINFYPMSHCGGLFVCRKRLENAEEYEQPLLYDKENEEYQPEMALLLKWAAKNPGKIIDLACGTGRMTIPLARHGFDCIGVDIHPHMLQRAKEKAGTLSIQWFEQDGRSLQLDVRAQLMFSVGNSFQHFLTNEDQDGLLSSVSRHLEKGGVFIFGTRFPSAEELLQPPIEEFWRSYQDRDTKVDLYTISHYDALQQIQHYTTIRKYKDREENVIDEQRTHIKLRYVFPKEMERLLEKHGFEIIEVYGDWMETPLTSEHYEMIYVCQKKMEL